VDGISSTDASPASRRTRNAVGKRTSSPTVTRLVGTRLTYPFTGTPAGSAKSKLTTVIMVSFPYNPNHLIPSDGGNHPSAAPKRMCPDSSADSCDVSGLRNLIFATVLLLAHVFEHIGWNQFHRRRQLTFKNREFHVPNLV
jgi:hypothetical protein